MGLRAPGAVEENGNSTIAEPGPDPPRYPARAGPGPRDYQQQINMFPAPAPMDEGNMVPPPIDPANIPAPPGAPAAPRLVAPVQLHRQDASSACLTHADSLCMTNGAPPHCQTIPGAPPPVTTNDCYFSFSSGHGDERQRDGPAQPHVRDVQQPVRWWWQCMQQPRPRSSSSSSNSSDGDSSCK